MRKITIAIVMLAAMISAMNASGSQESAADSNEVPVLRVLMSSGDAGPGNIKKALDHAAEIQGVELEYDVIPDDQMLNVVNTRLITDNAADLIIHNFGLTDVSSQHLASLSGPWTSKITTTTKPLTVDESGNIKKAPLGGESNMGLLYNKEVLKASGVELPLHNYDEFTAALTKIKNAGYTPVYLSNKEVWTAQILLLTSMTKILADDPDLIEGIVTNTVNPADVPELVNLFENAQSLKDLGLINEDYMSATNDMALEALANGECAFYAGLDSFYGTIQEFYPEKIGDIGMTYTPLWNDMEEGFVLFGTATNYLSVVDNSENKDLAIEFIGTMISREPLTTYYELVPGAVPYNDLGFDLTMSPLNAEMKGYAGDMASYSTFNNNSYDGETPLEPFYGKFNEQIQALYAGLSVEDTLNSWYEAYAADAKARRVDGF
jgi:raffinose/stachyose/melibiose transport system substrate-binding protein